MLTLAHLRINNHCVYISQSNDHLSIHCFKYNDRACDYSVFSVDDSDAAADYISTDLPAHRWGFIED